MSSSLMNAVYVIGPYRDENAWKVECNIRKAEEAALRLWTLGFAVMCPHTNTRFFNGALDDEVFLEGDKELLRRCDAALCVEGWEHSLGSLCEVRFAQNAGVKCFVSISDIVDYFGNVNREYKYAWNYLS